MQAASSPFRTAAGVRRALGLAGAIAMVVATTACTPTRTSAPPHARRRDQPSQQQHSLDDDERGRRPLRRPRPHAHDAPGHHAACDAERHCHDQTPGPDAARVVPVPVAVPVFVLRPGDTGPKVRSLQARLRQIGLVPGRRRRRYASTTTAAVHGFQAKRGFAATGTVDEQTWDKLASMTHAPTSDELANVVPKPAQPQPETLAWDLDERCMTGRVMCVSKTTRMLTWVVDGVPLYGFDVRFGSDELPTREGVFPVYHKQVDVISNLYTRPCRTPCSSPAARRSTTPRTSHGSATRGLARLHQRAQQAAADPAVQRGAHRRQGRRPLVTDC